HVSTLSLHDALPIFDGRDVRQRNVAGVGDDEGEDQRIAFGRIAAAVGVFIPAGLLELQVRLRGRHRYRTGAAPRIDVTAGDDVRSEEHTSELQSREK